MLQSGIPGTNRGEDSGSAAVARAIVRAGERGKTGTMAGMTRLKSTRTVLLAALLATAACGSKAQRAADAMAEGVQLNAAGQFQAAAAKFDYAVKLRDDLPALWIARARNQIALADYGGAFVSYRNALDQDRSNREALDAVAQLSLATNDLDKAEDYAGQILALDPSDVSGQMMRATVAFRRGRIDAADEAVGKTLAQDPGNEAARVLKSRILQRQGDAKGALALIAPIFDAGGGSADLRRQLVSLYERDADAGGLARVAERNARDRPRDAAVQIALARQLILTGRLAPAATALNALNRNAASDATRDGVVTMLIDADVAPGTVAAILSTLPAVEQSLAIAAAQHALAVGNGAVAAARLAPLVAAHPLVAATTDLHASYALALAQIGRNPEAARVAAAVLALDPGDSAALSARTLTEIAAGDLNAALRDARVVSRDNPGSAAAVALLAQIYRAKGDAASAAAAIGGGYNDNADDAGFLKLYVAQLVAAARADEAASIARSFTIRNPASAVAWRLRAQLSAAAKDGAGANRANAMLARLHGRAATLPTPPPEERLVEDDLRGVTGQ